MRHQDGVIQTFPSLNISSKRKDLTQMHANKSANVCFYDSGNNAIESDKSLPGKQFDDSTALAFFGPMSVASKSVTCQGEMHKDVHFSMDKPGWRIHAALKQGALFEGSPGAVPGPTRPGCPLFFYLGLVTFFVHTKEVTRR